MNPLNDRLDRIYDDLSLEIHLENPNYPFHFLKNNRLYYYFKIAIWNTDGIINRYEGMLACWIIDAYADTGSIKVDPRNIPAIREM